jgi:hypothetical protein
MKTHNNAGMFARPASYLYACMAEEHGLRVKLATVIQRWV